MNLEELKLKGKERWNEVLGRIEVESDSEDQLRTFYSCYTAAFNFPGRSMRLMRRETSCIIARTPAKVMPGRFFTDTGFGIPSAENSQ